MLRIGHRWTRRYPVCATRWCDSRRRYTVNDSTAAPSNMEASFSIRLYRIVLRQCLSLPDNFIITPKLDPHDNGFFRVLSRTTRVADAEDVSQFFRYQVTGERAGLMPSSLSTGRLFDERAVLKCNTLQIRSILKRLFKEPVSSGLKEQQKHALDAFRVVRQQVLLNATTVSTTASSEQQQQHGLTVTATSQLSAISLNDPGAYRYSYRVRVENEGNTTVQLLGRTWQIFGTQQENELTLEVHAPIGGVVGQLPVLQPGNTFEYHSSAEASASGRMEGTFHFAVVPADTPSAVIGVLPLAVSDKSAKFDVTLPSLPLLSNI